MLLDQRASVPRKRGQLGVVAGSPSGAELVSWAVAQSPATGLGAESVLWAKGQRPEGGRGWAGPKQDLGQGTRNRASPAAWREGKGRIRAGVWLMAAPQSAHKLVGGARNRAGAQPRVWEQSQCNSWEPGQHWQRSSVARSSSCEGSPWGKIGSCQQRGQN